MNGYTALEFIATATKPQATTSDYVNYGQPLRPHNDSTLAMNALY